MIITTFDINFNYISNLGEVRDYRVLGQSGSIFSVVVEKLTGTTKTYYNFSTQTFTSTYKRLKNRKITGGYFEGNIAFPAGGLSSGNNPNIYTISIFAESAYGTKHVVGKEARFADGSLDLNGSTGSNSNLLQKVLYQYPTTVVSFSYITPNAVTGFQSSTTSSTDLNLQRGSNTGTIPFSITYSLHSSKTGFTKRKPKEFDFVALTSKTIGEPLINPSIKVSNPESFTSGNPRAETNRIIFAEGGVVPLVGMELVDGLFTRHTDMPILVTSINPDGDNPLEVEFNQSFYHGTPGSGGVAPGTLVMKLQVRKYYRFKCSNVFDLADGMPLLISGTIDGGDGVAISRYFESTTQDIETINPDGSIIESTIENVIYDIPAISTLGFTPTVTNGIITSQAGVITLNSPQSGTIRNTTAKIYAYGSRYIRAIHNVSLDIKNLDITTTPITTTVNDASNADGETAQTNIVVASATGIRDDVSVMSGVNVTSTSVNPTVTNISGTTLTVSPAQYLQHGQTLTFTGAGQVFTITGEIDFKNIDSTDFSIYFDVEKFITAS
tara:strand:+ start:705 stop:2363 length:1659 start_codon:yes stop_codon:yes gene_type:complete